MPMFNIKKSAKGRKGTINCSYEDIDEKQLPKLHTLVLKNASTAKLRNYIAKKVSNINEKDKYGRYACALD